ncbi:MAG: hypothetical protein AAF216_06375 [Pseudomonadota bacterium]
MTLRPILLGTAALALVGCAAPETDDTAVVDDETSQVVEETPATDGKIIVSSEADLPRTEITLTKKPSEIVLGDGPEYDMLLAELDVVMTYLVENYVIEDDGTRRGILSAKRAVLTAQGDWDGVLEMTPTLRDLASKPADREMTGVISDSYARAALATGDTSSDAFEAAFRSELSGALSGVDVDIARDQLQATGGQMQMMNAGLLEAALKAQIDPAVEQAGMVIDRGTATSIIGIRQTIDMVPHMPMIAELVNARLAEVPEAEVLDLWAPARPRWLKASKWSSRFGIRAWTVLSKVIGCG